jgi:hypothetical protein
MKRAASLKFKFFAVLTALSSLIALQPAFAAVYSISQLTGGAAYAPSVYGQTFLVPVGKSGTISSVTNLGVTILNGSYPSVVWAKVWNSPSKTTLIASSSDSYTTTFNSGGFTSTATFSLNFPEFQVIGGTSYYLEIGRSSGNGSFYVSEASSNPYADGSVYHAGVIDTTYDLRFKLDITLGISASAPTLSLPSTAVKGIATTLASVSSVAGSISFKNNGKPIPGCQKVPASGSPITSICSWKPPVTGNSTITVTLFPSDNGTYTNTPSAKGLILVASRNTKR